MKHVYDDGGRKRAGFKGATGDCVTRAIAIATGKPYDEVYDAMHERNAEYASTRRGRVARKITRGKGLSGTTPRNGVFKEIYRPYLESLGWRWTPTMQIGSGCTVHLKDGELPNGRLIVKLSRHLCAVIDGVVHDTYDCTRDETRCVYGYFSKP